MYKKNIHLHNYAIWTAARAVQRSFTSTAVIREAIEYAELSKEIEQLKSNITTTEQYASWHKEVAGKVLIKLGELVPIKEKVTYGRAAKIIAIYLKTSIIVTSPEHPVSNLIHPPVDRILLDNLYMKYKNPIFKTSTSKWTEFGQDSYFAVIDAIREIQVKEGMKYFWEIEKYWNV
jgi:hypothetical protein